MSRRRFLVGVGAVGAGALGAACAPQTTAPNAAASPAPASAASPAPGSSPLKGTGSVVVYDGGGAWGAAMRAAYFDPFERDTGIRVVANPGAPAARIQAGIQAGAPGYDVIDISGGRLIAWAKDGFLLPIDYQYWSAEDKSAFSLVPTSQYGAPALFYALQIVYSTTKFTSDTGPKAWADVWDTAKFAGPRSLATGSLGPGGGTFEAALLADGVDPKRLYPLDLERALKSLTRLRSSIAKFWDASAEPPQLVADGNVAIASAYNGRVADRQAAGGKIAAAWDQALLLHDVWAVPKGAKNVENAMKFIAYASQARPMARFAEMITYSPPNAKAFDLIGSERASVLPTAPALRDKLVVADYGWWNTEASAGKTNEKAAVELWEKWLANK